jgi:hypothetical protein
MSIFDISKEFIVYKHIYLVQVHTTEPLLACEMNMDMTKIQTFLISKHRKSCVSANIYRTATIWTATFILVRL